MQDFSQYEPLVERDAPRGDNRGGRAGRRSRVWLWLLLGGGLFFFLPCSGLVGWVVYVGVYGPDTFVYTGNQVPARFIATMKDVGALDDGETISFFFSDGVTDIRNGFYFVSDQKVAIYTRATNPPLIVVRFDEIADLELDRNESFFEDSYVLLTLKDDRVVSFPVSSEMDRDQRFFDAIDSRVSKQDDAP